LLTLIVVPVVYTFLDDFGERVVALVRRRAPRPAAQREEARPAPAPEVVPAD
jgi:hypothetical protein